MNFWSPGYNVTKPLFVQTFYLNSPGDTEIQSAIQYSTVAPYDVCIFSTYVLFGDNTVLAEQQWLFPNTLSYYVLTLQY